MLQLLFPQNNQLKLKQNVSPIYHTYHGAKRQGTRRMVVHSNEIYEESSSADQSWNQGSTGQHLLYPQFPCNIKKSSTIEYHHHHQNP